MHFRLEIFYFIKNFLPFNVNINEYETFLYTLIHIYNRHKIIILRIFLIRVEETKWIYS